MSNTKKYEFRNSEYFLQLNFLVSKLHRLILVRGFGNTAIVYKYLLVFSINWTIMLIVNLCSKCYSGTLAWDRIYLLNTYS